MISDFEGAAELIARWKSGREPDPRQTVSEWSDKHRILSARGASEAGPYKTRRTPYMRGIMDALSPSDPAQKIVFMKAAQVGATEAGNNWLGYCIHRAPGPFLLVQPTVELAKRLSQQRIDPLISDCPELRDLVSPNRSKDSGNTMLSKRYPGGQMVLTGANSAVGLRSMPARWVFLDEVDAYPGDLDGEGDPISLAEARTISFGHRAKRFLASTPTVKGHSRIEREFELSDQRRYHVPCPHCSELQWLKFERLRWEAGRPETVAYVCEHCEEPIAERFKTQFMDEENGAVWLPTADAETLAKARAAGAVGFHISGLYSPLGWLSWSEIARKWEAAKGNTSELKTLKNTVLGETWQEKGEAPDWERLYDRRESWRKGEVPHGVVFLTAGVDVQKDRLEVDVWGWGRGLESWLIDRITIEGGPDKDEPWTAMTALLGRTWKHANGDDLVIGRLAIDTGYEAPAIYAWARKQGFSQVAPVKGADGFNKSSPVTGPTFVDITKGGTRLRRGARLWTIAVSTFKSETYRFLELGRPTDEEKQAGARFAEGTVHLPAWIDSEWVKQLVAEELITVKNRRGFTRLEWSKVRERNEALDCRVYARAAAWLAGIDRWSEAQWNALEAQFGSPEPKKAIEQEKPKPAVQAPPPARRNSWIEPRRGGWLR